MNNLENINAIERVESLAEELVMAYEEINLIYDIDEALGGMVNPEEIINSILKETVSIVGAGWGVSLLLSEVDSDVELAKSYSDSASDTYPSDEQCLRDIKSLGAMEKGIIINDLVGPENLNTFSMLRKNLLKVPLAAKENVIGVICLGDKKDGSNFSSMDMKLVNAVASRAASAIENSRLQIHFMEKERITQELSLARGIQEGLLPKSCPDIEGYEIATYSKVCTEVGGDYYDFIRLKSGIEGFVIGDVSGHGIGAALIMSSMRSALRALAGNKPSRLAERLNRIMVDDSCGKGMMMTLFYGVLEPEKRKMIYTNAGHDYPFIVRNSGEVDFLKSSGCLLGIFEDASYRECLIDLEEGDVMVLYTDGITEGKNSAGEQFGSNRLVEHISSLRNMKAEAIIAGAIDGFNRFAGDVAADDDLSLMVIKVEGCNSIYGNC